jgi:hypothetical protein
MSLRRNNRRGANALEFALTLPLFITITFGLMEFGHFFSRRALVNSVMGRSCREAALIDSYNAPQDAQYASCGGDGDDCIELVGETFMNTLSANAGLDCTSCQATVMGTSPGRYVRCEMVVEHQDITGFFTAIFPTQFRAETEVLLEWQRQAN